MSNYQCPNCQEIVIDSPGDRTPHVCGNTGYIPYSKRNNITDKDLSGLLDYLERVMGYEITHECCEAWNGSPSWNIYCGDTFYIGNNTGSVHFYTGATWMNGNNKPAFSDMPIEVFLHSYKTLLPVIRDIYGRK